MALTRSQELIKQLKEVKERDEITFPRIKERIERNGKFVSMRTIRRVFADKSEESAANFNYETTLLPIAEVLLEFDEVPPSDGVPCAAEMELLRSFIHMQEEEIERLNELKDHLEDRINFLIGQISLKDKRMDEKDQIIKRLMDKCL